MTIVSGNIIHRTYSNQRRYSENRCIIPQDASGRISLPGWTTNWRNDNETTHTLITVIKKADHILINYDHTIKENLVLTVFFIT